MKHKKMVHSFFEWMEVFVFTVIGVILAFTFLVRIISVSGPSMDQTLQDGDRLAISNLFYTPKQMDVVVVALPDSKEPPIIKRIIATEGQTVDIDFNAGIVSVDGVPLDEPYANEPTYTKKDLEFPMVVDPGCVFILGDNRNHSFDSRHSDIGMVDTRYILGRVLFRVYPFDKIGSLPNGE